MVWISLTRFHRIQGRGGRWSPPHWQARLRSRVVSRAFCAVRNEQNDASRRLTSQGADVRGLARKVTKHHEPINQINTSRTERVKKSACGHVFALDIEIPIQVDHRASPDLQRMKPCYTGPSAQRSVLPLVQSSPNTSWTRGSQSTSDCRHGS